MKFVSACNFEILEAVAHIMENSLTKKQYMNTRLENKRRNSDIYPMYDTILEGKKECYPDEIFVTEDACVVPLQSLVNHTSSRIFKVVNEIEKKEITEGEYEVIYKYGIDGTNVTRYKQRFKDVQREEVDETSVTTRNTQTHHKLNSF